MVNILKWEIKKIMSKKSLYILLCIIMSIIAIYFYFFDFIYDEAELNYEENKVILVQGLQAIEVRKELGKKFEGVLTDKTIKEMEKYIYNTDTILSNLSGDEKSIVKNYFRDQISILDQFKLRNEKLEDGKLLDKNSTQLVLGYHDGWNKIIISMESVSLIFIAFAVSLLFAGIFTEESNVFMDNILCATKYGKTKVVTAKILAALIIGMGILFIVIIFNLILYGFTYGLEGIHVSIQSSCQYVKSQYVISFGQLYFQTIILNILGLSCIISLTVFISACSKNTVMSLIVSLIINFAPIFFDFTDSIPKLQKILELLPIYMLHSTAIYNETNTYIGINQPSIMIAIATIVMIITISATKIIYKKHQV